MARFAPVVPTHMAASLQSGEDDYLGSYHLLLAHDILAQPKEYAEIYGHVRDYYGEESFIIMDNSIIELGKAMEMKDLLHACEILKPDCLVVPDIMGDGEGTRNAAVNFVRKYIQVAFEQGLSDFDIPPLMAVMQGSTIEDAMETLGVFYALPYVEYVGVPRILTKQHGSRMYVLQQMLHSPAYVNSGKNSFDGFHLLGFSDNVIDDIACARLPFVQGIDSAVPIRAGLQGIKLDVHDFSWSEKVGPRGNFWEQPCDKVWEDNLDTIKYNLDTFRKMIRQDKR